MSDGVFTMVTHRDPRLLDIVDDQWRKDKLPKDEITIPPEHDFPTDDGDNQEMENPDQLDKKWSELAMQHWN